MPDQPNVIIIGAGFGGITMARELAKVDMKITLIDRNNYHLFRPLLYQVATAGLTEQDIAYPVRFMFRKQKNIEFRMGEIKGIDLHEKYVTTDDGDKIGYDYLVVASGSMTNYFGMQSLSQNAWGIKELVDGVKLRNHVLKTFEKAAYERDADKRRALLTFVIVGGGPTGVETAGSLAELVYDDLAKGYHSLNFNEVRIVLVEASGVLLPAMPPDLQQNAYATLAGKRVEIRLLTQVADYDGLKLVLKDDTILHTCTVIWAAGVRAAALTDKIGVQQDRVHRVLVNQYLQIPGVPDAFIIGDAAHFVQNGTSLPMTAQVAIQQGKHTAHNLVKLIKNEPLSAFVYKPLGDFAVIGRNAAVGKIGSYKFKGYLAWRIWALVHIIRLTSFRNRLLVFIKWVWAYITYDCAEQIINS